MLTMSVAGFACSQNQMPDPKTVPDADTSEQVDPAEVAGPRTAILAGGCFWCVEAVYEMLDGVSEVESGYIGGVAGTANYTDVCSKTTRHAEAVRITYDPAQITFDQLLKVFFTTAHDPTQLNRQGYDSGTQYRSAIFPINEEQAQIARDYIDQLNASGQYANPIVTTVENGHTFYPAEARHQNYARNNPNSRYIQANTNHKIENTRDAFGELIRDEEDAPAE